MATQDINENTDRILKIGDTLTISLRLTELETGEYASLSDIVTRSDKDKTLFIFLRHTH